MQRAVPRPHLLLIFVLLLVVGSAFRPFSFALAFASVPLPPSSASTSSSMSSSEDTTTTACARNLAGGKHCVSCEGGLPALPPAEVEAALPTLPLWTLQEQADKSSRLSRSFVAKNFAAAMAFLNEVGAVAEAEGHHPDLHLTGYRNVEIVLYTHAVGYVHFWGLGGGGPHPVYSFHPTTTAA